MGRNILVLVFALLPLSAMAASALQVCVSRQEDNGSINIYPVDVMVNGHKAATLLGGKRACMTAKGAAPKIWLRWHDVDFRRPDHGLHGKRLQTSKPLPLIAELKTMRLQVCSVRSKQGAPPRWHIVGDGPGRCS